MKKIILSIILCVNISSLCASPEKIKIYAFYTPSHKVFVDEWFLPSLKDDYEVVFELHEQECASAAFMSKGWVDTMVHKVDVIIRGIEENWGKIFIHSDVDVQFLRPTKALILAAMEGKDMVVQKNRPEGELCAGFFACRANEKTLKLWQTIRFRMTDLEYLKASGNTHDQKELNRLIREANPFDIVWDYLPNEFFAAGTLTGKGWKPGRTLKIPKNIVLHHANYTMGIRNKIAQLKYVRTLFDRQNNQ